jgi:hypothetical protein
MAGARCVRERHGAEAVARRERCAGADQPVRQRLAPGVGGREQRHVQLQRVGVDDQVELAGPLAARGGHQGRCRGGRLLGVGRRNRQQTGGGEQA